MLGKQQKSGRKLGHKTGKWSQAHHQIHNVRDEKENNQDVALLHKIQTLVGLQCCGGTLRELACKS